MKRPPIRKPKYYLNEQGAFVIEEYTAASPFANFFPGIAGTHGIPMWVFYVNRGQAISSFGIRDKDHAILEFLPANRAWETTPLRGFRTFLKVTTGSNTVFYEPFYNGFPNLSFTLTNRMLITPEALTIEETNRSLGLVTTVEYFTIPMDRYAGLARIVTLTNTGGPKHIEMVDGLPQLVPFGTNNFFLKEMSRTIEAWMTVDNLAHGIPFYRLRVDPTDRPEVVPIDEGNFYLSFHYERGKPTLITPLVDPECLFGPVTDFSCPYQFLTAAHFRPPPATVTHQQNAVGIRLPVL